MEPAASPLRPPALDRDLHPACAPRQVADIALAAAVRSQADTVYLEPMPMSPEVYLLTFERHAIVLATVSIDAPLANAVIARLAFVAELDLAAAHASSGVVPVRSGSREAEVVITVRPGRELRAELMVAHRHGHGARTLGIEGIAKDPAPGETIDQYRVVEFLGEGGMGTVFAVEHVALGRRYALKLLRSRLPEGDREASRRLLCEARAAARVHHPNIVDVFDFGSLPDGRPYLVMELIEGESLGDWIDRGPLLPAEAVAVARQLGEALATAHERGVVHADVTPSNVLVVGSTDHPQIKLVDFGLAEYAGEPRSTSDGTNVFGTPAYISPEQLRGAPATDRSDQYGLGAVLFEMLTGHPPFLHEDLIGLCKMHVEAPIPIVTSPHGPLPPRLVDLVTTCLQKSPQSRFPGFRAFLTALDEVEHVTNRRGWRRWLAS